jgi:hypothetical protein
MSILENPKMKFLLILPIIGGIIFFGTGVMESDMADDTQKRERLLSQFAINYESMMTTCSEDDLNSEELQSCLDAFKEVRGFCLIESADQCGDEQMERLEQKLLNL